MSSPKFFFTVMVISSTLLIATQLTLVQATFIHKTEKLRHKRSFQDIQCKGVYDKTEFNQLEQVCEDCYNLLREEKLHILCRSECFTTNYFRRCVDALNMTDEILKFEKWIKKLSSPNITA